MFKNSNALLTLMLQRCDVVRLGRVEERQRREALVRVRQQHLDNVQEGGPRRRSVLPAAPHQVVQLIRTIFRPFHHPAVDHVPQHLVVGETLRRSLGVSGLRCLDWGRTNLVGLRRKRRHLPQYDAVAEHVTAAAEHAVF